MLRIEQPQAYRVYQRDEQDTACIAVQVRGEGPAEARLLAGSRELAPWQPLAAGPGGLGTEVAIRVGGPYTLEVRAGGLLRRVRGILVGDLWITAGQSNMDGVGALSEAEPPGRGVHACYYDDRWGVAREPLCWYNEAVDPVHWGVAEPEARQAAIRFDREFRTYGAGPAVAFGKAMVAATGVPVGLVVCSHGGTSMDQWSPGRRSEGGSSLYGSLLRRVAAVGGRVKGCLWYQGESDAFDQSAEQYRQKMREFVAVLRADLGDPELPLVYVQIGRCYVGDPAQAGWWDRVQDDQLRLEQEGELGRAAMVPAIDGGLTDAVHLDSRAQRRLGRRMAVAARRLAFGREDETCGPRPGAITLSPDGRTIRVQLDQVNGRLAPRGKVWGFTVQADGQPVPLRGCRVDPARPDCVLLRLAQPARGEVRLWYGQGHNPVVNLRDARGWSLPCFGPAVVKLG